jgi:threonine/homoserine/homoserine lactone efflux protein
MIEILLLVGTIQLIGVISPGPDFALILRNSIMHHKSAALWSAFGIALGVLVHVAYTLLGLNFLMAEYPYILKFVGLIGAAYLGWMGIGGLRAKKSDYLAEKLSSSPPLTARQALMMGFLVNVTNPKCIVFFVSFLSSVIAADHDPLTSMFIGLEIFLITWIWFSFLAIALGHKRLQNKIQSSRYTIDKCVGLLFLIFSISIASFIWK